MRFIGLDSYFEPPEEPNFAEKWASAFKSKAEGNVFVVIHNKNPTFPEEILSQSRDKSKRVTAFLEGDDTANPEHPNHAKNLRRAVSDAKDVVNALTEYLDAYDEKDWRDFMERERDA